MTIDWILRSQNIKPEVRDFVGGRWTSGDGDSVLEKYCPRDGKLLCRFNGSSNRGVNRAVAVAREAFEDGRWSKQPVHSRKKALYALASLIEQHGEELAVLECMDVGKPISEVVEFDIPAAAATIRYNAEAADKSQGNVYAADHSGLSYQLRRPMGVVAGIIGWNFPLVLAAVKIGPALATGNCLVLKPSELSSFSAARIAELAVEAGVPPGVLNVIHGDSRPAAALAKHAEVDLVTFTGSSATGKQLLIASGISNMKRLILECGSKSPNIVFGDSPDLEAVADAVVARAFWNQGQVCTASSRLLVENAIKDELLRIVIEKVDALRPGDPLRADTRLGALISEAHRKRVLNYIEHGQREGARKVYQSDAGEPIDGGFYVSPVIFDEVSSKHKIAQEEIFGPVLSVIGFEDEEEAVRIANDTVYGLSAILWTRDLGRAHRVIQGVNAGWMVVNATSKPVGGPTEGALPVAGHRESGIGTEGGLEGLAAYTSTTTVQYYV